MSHRIAERGHRGKVAALFVSDFSTRAGSLNLTAVSRVQLELTDVGHLGDAGKVDFLCELGGVVVDVVDFNVEFSVGLQLCVGVPVQHLCVEGVHGLLLPVQPLGGVNVARLLVDQEQGAGAVSGQDVPDIAISFVHVGVQLEETKKQRQLYIFVYL